LRLMESRMQLDDLRKTAIRLLEILTYQGHVERSLVTDDMQWWVQGRGSFGYDEFTQILNAFRSDVPVVEGPELTVVGSTVEGDRVALETENFRMHANGVEYRNTYHFLMVFRGDRICQVKEYYNSGYARDFAARMAKANEARG
jgi:ketosteroid isomerase-like protein